MWADEDAREIVAMWIGKGKWDKVAELWCGGVGVDWSLLEPVGPRRRVHLPVYPFAKEVYCPKRTNISLPADTADTRGVLHPLLHENTSNLTVQRFSSRLHGEEFFLADHRVSGRRTLPGMASWKWHGPPFAAPRVLGRTAPLSRPGLLFQDIAWIRPITVNEDLPGPTYPAPVRSRTIKFPSKSLRMPIRIARPPVIHAQGTAMLVEPHPQPDLDLARLRAECDRVSLDAARCYQAFRRIGLDYGPAFQAIESIGVGGRTVVATLRLPACVPTAAERAGIVLASQPHGRRVAGHPRAVLP